MDYAKRLDELLASFTEQVTALARRSAGQERQTTGHVKATHDKHPTAILTKEETIARFRDLSAARPVRSNSLTRKHPELARAVIVHFGSLRAARKAARIAEPPPATKWTKRKIIAELRRFHREHPRVSHGTLAAAGRADLRGAIELHFGSIVRARRAARIPDPPKDAGQKNLKWPAELVLAEIIARQENGEPINSEAVPSVLRSAGVNRFGTWAAAVAAAGYDYKQIRLARTWTRQEIIRELRRRAARGDHSVGGTVLQGACRRHFGTVAAARRAAGIDEPERGWTRARVVQVLRERAREGEFDIPPNLVHACRRHFPSIPAARRAAGIDAIVSLWTKAHVVAYFEQHPNAYVRGGGLAFACRRLFGSVVAARLAAGAVDSMIGWPKDKLLKELRRRVRARRGLGGLMAACEYHFGSIRAARETAGVPARPRSRWSRKRVLAEVRAVQRRGGSLHRNLIAACVRYFGSISRARTAARSP